MNKETKTEFRGPGEWRSQAAELETETEETQESAEDGND